MTLNRYPVVGYNWADPDGFVHEITCPIEGTHTVGRREVETHTGESRATCGIQLNDFRYYFTRNAVSCTWCIIGEFAGWRSVGNR